MHHNYFRVLWLVVAGLLLAQCGGRPPLTFSPDTLPPARVGQAYQATITVGGNTTPVGQIEVVRGALPAGLALDFDQDTESASIHGIPQEAGQSSFTIYAWCFGTNVSGQTGEHEYSITVE